MTVSASEGTAPIWAARKVMPSNSEPRMTDIQISVMPALRLRGSLKAVMPLEIASTPVSAVVPLEKARRIRKSESGLRAVQHLHRRRVGHHAQGARRR